MEGLLPSEQAHYLYMDKVRGVGLLESLGMCVYMPCSGH